MGQACAAKAGMIESRIADAERGDIDAYLDLGMVYSSGGGGIDLRTDAAETVEIVDPEADVDAMFAPQLARQAPANADVAVIVDNLAEQGEGKSWSEWHVDTQKRWTK